jgi:hypothetical protein
MHADTQPQTQNATDQRALTSNVLTVVLRVAGPVETSVRPHALGYPERQVSVRIGDALIHLTDPKAAERIRQRWDAGFAGALRLRRQVSQTWLQPRPGTYPVAVSVHLTREATIGSQFIAADTDRHQPAHLAVRVDQLLWQVCDLTAWRAIGDAWLAAYEYLRQ